MLKHYDNQSQLELGCYIEVQKNNPSLSEKEILQKISDPDIVRIVKRRHLRKDFVEKMTVEMGNPATAETIATKYFDTLPEEFMPNIVEWCEGQPLSDIKYKGMSLSAIMYYNPSHPLTMKATLQAFTSWQGLHNPEPEKFLSLYIGGIR